MRTSPKNTLRCQIPSKAAPPLLSKFLRLTPGRGKRPEVLFNLDLSSPPALFFVYEIHPYVKLFGKAETVHCEAHYEGLRDDASYDRFTTCLTVRFQNGARSQWTWAGGISIDAAIQEARIVSHGATFIETKEGWDIATPTGTTPLEFVDNDTTLETLFLDDIRGGTDWQADVRTDLEADRISLAAEVSATEGRVVEADEIGSL